MYSKYKKILSIFFVLKKIIRRHICRPRWHNLRSLSPISKVFGYDRGIPIDRAYIEKFLENNKEVIKNRVCEIGECRYMKKFGVDISQQIVFSFSQSNSINATFVGDLSVVNSLPESVVDCFICTQTLNFIYDFKSAIRGIYRMLDTGGVLLATVAGLCQISRYDMDKWGDYWRFTDHSIKIMFAEVFGVENVEVEVFGNVLAATSLLHGIAAEELTYDEIFYKDNDYQVIISVKAFKV